MKISPIIIIVMVIIIIGSPPSCIDHKLIFYFYSIIPTAFFVCFTLSALWVSQRTYLYLGGSLLCCNAKDVTINHRFLNYKFSCVA